MIDKKKLIPAYIRGSKPEELFTDLLEGLVDVKEDVRDLGERVARELPTEEQLLALIEPLIPEKPADGHAPTAEELKALIKPLIPEPKKGERGTDGTKLKPEQARDLIKSLKGEKKLSIFDLKDWEWLRGRGKERMQFTSAANNIITDATLTGNGTAASPLHAVGGGGGITVTTPPEAVDGVRTTFTSATAPRWVVADGTTYFLGFGFAYAGSTITMDVAPSQVIRVII